MLKQFENIIDQYFPLSLIMVFWTNSKKPTFTIVQVVILKSAIFNNAETFDVPQTDCPYLKNATTRNFENYFEPKRTSMARRSSSGTGIAMMVSTTA